jgi:pimeloyl-ACP methyl ester carboxylesterase
MKRTKALAIGATAAVGVATVRGYRAASRRPTERGAVPAAPPDDLLEVPADVSHRMVPTPDGGQLHVVERGTGRPLVLLHGITLRADVWAPQFHQMADDFRVIALDLRGHGRSTAGRDGYGLPRLAADLSTVLEALDLRDAVLVGHSMGGMTIMQFCGDHPDVLDQRGAGVVFLATRAHAVIPPLVAGVARRLGDRAQARLEAGGHAPQSAELGGRLVRVAFGKRPSPKAVAQVAEMTTSIPPEAFLPSGLGLLDHDARDALRRTRTPSLVVVGSRDLLTPVRSSRHLADLLEGSQLHVLPGAGHQLMQERPDRLAELIYQFVAGLSGAAAEIAWADVAG